MHSMARDSIVDTCPSDAIALAIEAAAELRERTSKQHKSAWGQFFTPAVIGELMASWIDTSRAPIRLLDLGAGTGLLGICAAIRALHTGTPAVHLVAVECEPAAITGLRLALKAAAKSLGPRFSCELIDANALDLHSAALRPTEFGTFHAVISNPPYFKISPRDKRGGDAPNVYARFMEIGAELLCPGGQLVYITPRSFTSGLYFRRFRRHLHARMTLERIHVFGSRKRAFRRDDVLQENVIVAYRKGPSNSRQVTLTSSQGLDDLASARAFCCDRERILCPSNPEAVLFLPTSEDDLTTMREVFAWPSSVRSLGLQVSTGKVVPFRTDRMRSDAGATTVPLLWLQHIVDGGITWPLASGFRKPEHIEGDAGSKLLVANETYILIRRFSAKEYPRRLMLGLLRRGELPGTAIGLENHINYVHRPGGQLDEVLALGLAAVLSSSLVDAFFRVQSGNTQVSATELRSLPLPAEPSLRALGKSLQSRGQEILADQQSIDEIVGKSVLDRTNAAPT